MTSIGVAKIKKTEWKKWGSRRLTYRLIEHWCRCTEHFKEIFSVDFPDLLFLIKNEIGHGYLNKKQLNECLQGLLDLIHIKSFRYFYEKKATATFSDFLKYCKSLEKSNLKEYNNQQLLKKYQEFLNKEDYFTNCTWIIFILDENLSQKFESDLKIFLRNQKQEERFDEYLKIIYSPDKKSALFLQLLDILKLAQAIRAGKIKDEESRINDLKNKYAFFNIMNFDEEPLGYDHFQNEVYKIVNNNDLDPGKEMGRINAQFQDTSKRYKTVAEYLKADDKLAKLAEVFHMIAYYRDYRNDIRRECYYHARHLYLEIARRMTMSMTDVLFLTREEIRIYLNGGKPIADTKNRRKLSAMTFIDKKFCSEFKDSEVNDLLATLEPNISLQEFRGIAASPGKVSGKVKIIFNVGKEASKLERS